MQVVVNEEFVRSKVRVGNITHLVSLGLLVVGFALSLPFGRDLLGAEAIFFAYACMIVALLLLNYGRVFTRRWGPRFRQDQWLVQGLRGLDNRHTLYNYPGPDLPDHVLVGPTGLFVFIPRLQSGPIIFDGRRWSRGSAVGALLRNFTEGGLGNPLGDVRNAIAELAAYLRKHGSEDLIQGLEARPIVVFTNPRAQLDVHNAPLPVVQLKELKTIFRRAKQTLSPEKVEELKQVLGREVGET